MGLSLLYQAAMFDISSARVLTNTYANCKMLRDEGRVLPEVKKLFDAAENNDVEGLKAALQHVDVNSRDASGLTPLHYAASTLAEDAIRHLVAYPGIDATLADRYQRSAATVASECWPIQSDKVVAFLNPHCYPWLYTKRNRRQKTEPTAPTDTNGTPEP